ncbi:MAG: AsmA family protein [Elusimicrobia bacterium]|nr:AsmA family protein [Elusimicrobiota bacterium]
MKLLLQLAAVAAAVAALALVAATIAVKRYLPPEKVRSLIAGNVQKAIHREVRLGDISLGLLQGLTIKDLEISRALSFKEGVFARAGSAQLKMRWRPLLHRKVVVDRVVLKGLRLAIRKEADGRFDFRDLLAAKPAAPPSPKAAAAAGLPLVLDIHETSLADGGVAYEDASSSASWSISDIDAKITDFSLARPFDAELSLKAQGKAGPAPVEAAISFAGRIDPAGAVPGKMSVAIQRASVESFGIKVGASGTVKDFSAPEADLTARVEEFKSAALKPFGLPDDLTIPATDIAAKFRLSGEDLKLDALQIKTSFVSLEASGKAQGLGSSSPQLDLLVKCRSFLLEPLAQVSAKIGEFKPAGGGYFAAAIRGPARKPMAAGKLTFKGVGATVAGLKLSDLAGTVSFDDRELDLPDLTGQVGAGTLALDLTVKDYAASPAVTVNGSLTQFDLDPLLAAKPSAAPKEPKPAGASAQGGGPGIKTDGKFTVKKLTHSNAVANDLRISWDLNGITPDLKGLSGSAKVDVGAGKLENLGKLAASSTVAKILMLPLVVMQKIGGIQFFPDLNNIGFDSIVGDYGFQSGLMTLRQSHFQGPSADVTAQGTIDLPAEKLDLVVTAQVGRVAPIEVEVKGTFDKPQSKPRIGKFIAEPAKQLFNRLLGR